MGSEWKTLQLKEVGITLIDCVHKTPPDVGTGIPYIAIPQMKEGRIDFSANPRLISNEHYVEWTKKAKPHHNDIILSRRCNPGETSYVPPGVKFALGQNLVLLRSDGSKVQPAFLRWLVRGRDWWGQVGKFINVGAIFDSLKCAEIPKFELPIPPLPEQKAITHVLGALDDRIELNRRMNETLEAMAQALFKSWFVDFDPVIDNALASGKEIPAEFSDRAAARAALGDKRQPVPAEIRTLFPDEFTHSTELGWIPKGWEVGAIKQLCEKIQNGGTPKRDRPEYWEQGTVPWLTSGEVQQTIITGCKNNITPLGLEKSSAKWLSSGATVVALYGATAGKVAFVASDLTTNQAVCGLVPKEDCRFFNYLSLERSVSYLANQASGSAQQNISKGIVEATEVIIPVRDILRGFEKQCQPIFDKWVAHLEANEILAKLRDTLLPKLLSGELRIPEAEKQVEELAL